MDKVSQKSKRGDSMKMTTKHLSVLKEGVDKVLAAHPNAVNMYEKGAFPRSEKVKDLQKRFCYASGIKIGDGIGTHGDIIGNYTDNHLYTALKSLCPTVKKVTV